MLPKASASSRESGHMGGGGGIIWKWRKTYFKVSKQTYQGWRSILQREWNMLIVSFPTLHVISYVIFKKNGIWRKPLAVLKTNKIKLNMNQKLTGHIKSINILLWLELFFWSHYEATGKRPNILLQFSSKDNHTPFQVYKGFGYICAAPTPPHTICQKCLSSLLIPESLPLRYPDSWDEAKHTWNGKTLVLIHT